MACLAFTLCLCRPHTHNADTCMQGFPGIIYPAFCSASQVTSFLVSPPPPPHTHTPGLYRYKETQMCSHKQTYACSCSCYRSNSFITRFIPCWCFLASVAAHSCCSSWDPSIPTIPPIHLSLWLQAKREELPVSTGLRTGIHNLFNALSVSPQCLFPDRPSKVSVRGPWPKYSHSERGCQRGGLGLLAQTQ